MTMPRRSQSLQVPATVFVCVGATKAGTSWLHQALSAHPDCHFRTIKELHYFSCQTSVDFDQALVRSERESAKIERRLSSQVAPANRPWMERHLGDLKDWQQVLRRKVADPLAYMAYLTEGRQNRAVVGEITPAYALLNDDAMSRLGQVAADVRVLYLMRDPVARLWSHVRMVAHRAAPARFAETARALLARMVSGDLSGEGQGIARRGDYATIIPKLRRVFDPAQLLVMFAEELLSLPGLARLSAFLGIRPVEADLSRRVFSGQPLDMTSEQRRMAHGWLRPQYDYVSAEFPSLPKAWRANMEEGFA